VQVDGKGTKFSYLTIGNSDIVRVGETVYAIGSPLGDKNTFDIGYISRMAPVIHFDIYSVHNMIQVSYPIQGGSSGGALLNVHGEAIGVTSAGDSRFSHFAYAVPIARVDLNSFASGRTEPLPIAVPSAAQLGGELTFYPSYPFIPDFLSVSDNASLLLGATANDIDFIVGDNYEFEFVFVYELDNRHFVRDTDKYDDVLMDNGFQWQGLEVLDDITVAFLYHPIRDISLTYAFVHSDDLLFIAVGRGNALDALSGGLEDIDILGSLDITGYERFSFVPDFGVLIPYAEFLESGDAYRFISGDHYALDDNIYILSDDYVYVYWLDDDIAENAVGLYELALMANGFDLVRSAYYADYDEYAALFYHAEYDVYVSVMYEYFSELVWIIIG
jgi:hypothetical protein